MHTIPGLARESNFIMTHVPSQEIIELMRMIPFEFLRPEKQNFSMYDASLIAFFQGCFPRVTQDVFRDPLIDKLD